jgi:DNA-binding MarR family transcriptional regulator
MDSLLHRFQVALESLKRGVNSDLLQKMDSQVTGPQIYMLYYINQQETCKLTQLAEKMEVKPSAITVMIDRLEKHGFVKRTHDTVDRRSVLVQVTPAGKEVLEKAMRQRNEILGTYLSRLEPTERLLIAELLEKMVSQNHRAE